MKSLVIVIYNPAAKTASDKKIARATEFLEKKGFAVEVLRTQAGGHARPWQPIALRKTLV